MDRYVFRGKRLDNGEWAYGAYLNCGGLAFIVGHENVEVSGRSIMANPSFEVDPKTVGQCRFNDSQNKPTYDGDIVEDERGRQFVVFYSEHFQRLHLRPHNQKSKSDYEYYDKVGVEVFSWTYPDMKLTVIGNIHEKEAPTP